MENFLAGVVGGISVQVVTHPMETIKVNMISHIRTQTPPYKSSLDCAIKIFMGETPQKQPGGLSAFYRGVAAPMVGVGLGNAALFGTYGYLAQLLTSLRGESEQVGLHGHLQNETDLTVPEAMFCASGGAVASSFALAPFELVKMRMISEPLFSHREYYGPLDCARKIYRQGGITKLYRGWTATVIRDVPGSIAYFGCYGLTRQLLPQDEDKLNTASILFAGGVAGVAQWMLIYPLDVIKTHIHIEKDCVSQRKDWLQTWRYVYNKGGVASFYVGLSPALTRAFVSNAVCFLGVEAFLRSARMVRQDRSDVESLHWQMNDNSGRSGETKDGEDLGKSAGKKLGDGGITPQSIAKR